MPVPLVEIVEILAAPGFGARVVVTGSAGAAVTDAVPYGKRGRKRRGRVGPPGTAVASHRLRFR
ncbi:hypothetical protein [Streptomyces mangrovisoli]|uniref:Uncharacterized protein n=1 Tax=Streptomyces mangrovisoli TaxID=1428628 RepID=A0A1J4NSY5_9ACTN|nr:hypothetical protein [Streptomyces mangrovisoli]OIJ65416.1 hypothetical protein WN71_024450 [Streptomyces mangrovisoli]